MGFTNLSNTNNTVLSKNTKVIALETSLNQSIVNFQDLVSDFQQLLIDSENYKLQYLTVQEKCKVKTCEGAEELKKIITTKDNIIQAVASTLTKLNETKDFNMLTEAFKILFEEVTPLTPPVDDSSKSHSSDNNNKAVSPICEYITPCEVETSITEDISYKEEDVSEIDGTPTGRTSPVIPTRKTRSTLVKAEGRDKKKCPDNWPTPERKSVKLIFPPCSRSTPKAGRKLRQSRLNLITLKTSSVVDLTCSPEVLAQKQDQLVQPLIKKESVEEDTILPSPTSGPADLFKTTLKPSPSKFKRPKPLSLKSRCENIKQDENKDTMNNGATEMDESINILNQFSNRIRKIKEAKVDSPIKKENCTPIKKEKDSPVKNEMEIVKMDVTDEDATNASITLQDIEQIQEGNGKVLASSLERPLVENINILNTPPKNELGSSISVLRPDNHTAALDTLKRQLAELAEPVYKEPAVRSKAEKRNLQGWSCEECKNFYGVLYKDDPVMLAKKIQECSKHRGRHNPERPKTPPNFWNPRWTVPQDTEELNIMNNAD